MFAVIAQGPPCSPLPQCAFGGYGGTPGGGGGIYNPAVSSSVGTGRGSTILQLFLTNFITIALGIAGVIAFIFLLWGGIEYILAGGDKERTQAASKRITHALIGLAIVLSVFAIIFVVETLFGVSLTQITIPVIQ